MNTIRCLFLFKWFFCGLLLGCSASPMETEFDQDLPSELSNSELVDPMKGWGGVYIGIGTMTQRSGTFYRLDVDETSRLDTLKVEETIVVYIDSTQVRAIFLDNTSLTIPLYFFLIYDDPVDQNISRFSMSSSGHVYRKSLSLWRNKNSLNITGSLSDYFGSSGLTTTYLNKRILLKAEKVVE